jgi:heterodisulfide reductase subunit C
VLAPAGPALDSLSAEYWLWVVHFLACFLALALLPFSKLLHIVATPLSLLADAILGRSGPDEPEETEAKARAARRALDLTACTGCGTCSQHCSVLAPSRVTAGDLALPSLKLAAMAGLNQKASPADLKGLRLAADLCTRCQRCTRVCPAGIDLQDLWTALDEEMESLGSQPSYIAARTALVDNQKANGGGEASPTLTVPGETSDLGVLEMALEQGYFRYCFQCQTCSNVCPVVGCFEHASQKLGLLPHQIMYSLELGLVDQAVSAGMTWDCLTCYQCQEHCPQGVPVTDLLYELRNQGFWLNRSGGPAANQGGGQS